MSARIPAISSRSVSVVSSHASTRSAAGSPVCGRARHGPRVWWRRWSSWSTAATGRVLTGRPANVHRQRECPSSDRGMNVGEHLDRLAADLGLLLVVSAHGGNDGLASHERGPETGLGRDGLDSRVDQRWTGQPFGPARYQTSSATVSCLVVPLSAGRPTSRFTPLGRCDAPAWRRQDCPCRSAAYCWATLMPLYLPHVCALTSLGRALVTPSGLLAAADKGVWDGRLLLGVVSVR